MGKLVYSDGRPVSARDITAAKLRASLAPGPGGGVNPYPYDSAQPYSADMQGWMPWIRSPDAEINVNRDRMAARARDLVRNDGWANGSVNRLLDGMIGSHFFPIPRPNWRVLAREFGPRFDLAWCAEFQSAVRGEYDVWAHDPGFHCDATRSQSLTQMFNTAARAKCVEGDGLALLMWNPDAVAAGGARYATTLQLIDPDRLSNPLEDIDSADRRGGVQIDKLGAPIGYHIRRAHQYDWYNSVESITWDYFPRETGWGRPVMVHAFDRERAGQHRGIGILHQVLSRFRQMVQYDDAALKAAIVRATLGFFITSQRDENQVRDSLEAMGGQAADDFFQTLAAALYQQQPITMNGVRTPVLPPGDKMQMVSPNTRVDDYTAIQDAGHRHIAQNTGQSSVEVSNDFSKLNYSSFRGAMLQASRTLIRRRADFAIGFAQPVYSAWLEEVVERFPEIMPRGIGSDQFLAMRAALCQARWIGPGRGWVDPVKERQGEVLGLDAGFGTLEDTCADIEGEYWEDRLDQRAVEVAAMRARDLKMPDWAGGVPANQTETRPQPA